MAMASNTKKGRTEAISIPPGLAWLTVFLPALSYFLATRFSSLQGGTSSSSSLGTTVTDNVHSTSLQQVFILSKANSLQLKHPLQLIDDSSFQDIVASTWRHDGEQLGRGYLLLSSANANGRIWRWERGGGPIPIGKTLAMDPSGCRSKPICKNKDNDNHPSAGEGTGHCGTRRNGSGGLAIDFYQKDNFREGALVVAEWGEGRIVRLQDDTGARTPLIINVPSACQHASARPRRIERPIHMLYTPLGDLLVLEQSSLSSSSSSSSSSDATTITPSSHHCSQILRLKEAVHVPPLDSAMTSRLAHKWNDTHHNHPIDVLYKTTATTTDEIVGSMALDSTGDGLYVTVKRQADASVLLVRLNLVEEDDVDVDDDDDDEQNKESTASTSIDSPKGLLQDKARVQVNLTEIGLVDCPPPQAMAVDDKGHVFLAVPDGVLVLKLRHGKQVLGTLATPTPITSLTLGDDKYLYVTTPSQLLRIRVQHGPPKLSTNRVRKSTISRHKS